MYTGTLYIIIYYSALSARDRQKHLLVYTLNCVPPQAHCSVHTHIHTQTHTHIYTFSTSLFYLDACTFIYFIYQFTGTLTRHICTCVIYRPLRTPCVRCERKFTRKTCIRSGIMYTVYTLAYSYKKWTPANGTHYVRIRARVYSRDTVSRIRENSESSTYTLLFRRQRLFRKNVQGIVPSQPNSTST